MCVIVLASGAGGADPQWNSTAPACRSTRFGDPVSWSCGQASFAVIADDKARVVLKASPDLRHLMEQTPALQPSDRLRTSIAVVGLTAGDVDVLLTLRERQSFTQLGTPRVQAILVANPMVEVLNHMIGSHRALPVA